MDTKQSPYQPGALLWGVNWLVVFPTHFNITLNFTPVEVYPRLNQNACEMVIPWESRLQIRACWHAQATLGDKSLKYHSKTSWEHIVPPKQCWFSLSLRPPGPQHPHNIELACQEYQSITCQPDAFEIKTQSATFVTNCVRFHRINNNNNKSFDLFSANPCPSLS